MRGKMQYSKELDEYVKLCNICEEFPAADDCNGECVHCDASAHMSDRYDYPEYYDTEIGEL